MRRSHSLHCSEHRPPPGEQAAIERWSVGFFTRPSDNAILRAISDKSALIAEAAAKGDSAKYQTGVNTKEWVVRRTSGLRYNNYKVRPNAAMERHDGLTSAALIAGRETVEQRLEGNRRHTHTRGDECIGLVHIPLWVYLF